MGHALISRARAEDGRRFVPVTQELRSPRLATPLAACVRRAPGVGRQRPRPLPHPRELARGPRRRRQRRRAPRDRGVRRLDARNPARNLRAGAGDRRDWRRGSPERASGRRVARVAAARGRMSRRAEGATFAVNGFVHAQPVRAENLDQRAAARRVRELREVCSARARLVPALSPIPAARPRGIRLRHRGRSIRFTA